MCIWVRLWRPEVLLTLVALRLWSVRMVDVRPERRPLASSVQQEQISDVWIHGHLLCPWNWRNRRRRNFVLKGFAQILIVTSRRGGSFLFLFLNISNIKLRDNPAAVYRSIRRFTEHFASSGRALGVVVFEFARYILIFFYGLEMSRVRASCAASCRQ